MVTIKDIYQWINFPPEPPSALTPLQKIEWRERNSQMINDFNNKSFVGEFLVAVPANISKIEKNKIDAYSNYIQISMDEAQQISLKAGFFNNYELTVSYEIFYDEPLYETVKLIHDQSMIEFEGTIITFSHRKPLWDGGLDHHPLGAFNIQLRLSNIKVISKTELYSNLLNDNHYFLPNNKSSEKSTCFIATAAFGREDITEVIQLREFRDNVLRNSFTGRCFISTYEFLSPSFAMVIRQSFWLRKITRSFLRKVVLPMTKRRTN